MHIRLLFSGITVIHQRHAEVKILRFLSGQLAVGNRLVPLQLHAGVVLFHNECTHTEAGLVVLVVRDRVNGVDARLIRRTEGHADIVEQAGELGERVADLAKRVQIDTDFAEQTSEHSELIAVENVVQIHLELTDRSALLHNIRERRFADRAECVVDQLQELVVPDTLGQLHEHTGGHVAGHAAVDGENVELVGRVSRDEALAQLIFGLFGIDARRVHLDGDLRLVHGQLALTRFAVLIGLVALEDHADLLLACAHLGIGQRIHLAAADRRPLLHTAADAAVFLAEHIFTIVLNREVSHAQRALFGQRGGVPVDEVFKDRLQHDIGVHVVGDGNAILEHDLALNTVIGHFNRNVIQLERLVVGIAVPREVDGL